MSDVDISRTTVGVVGACWYLDPARFVVATDRFVAEATGGAPVQRCMVAMKGTPPAPGPSGHDRSEWLSGNGPFLDVSAYAAAAAALPQTLPMYLVFNDTLFTRHAWRLISRRLSAVRATLAAYPDPVAAAEIHPSTDLLLIDPHNPARRHLSTFCLLLNNSGFRLMRRLLDALPASGEPDTVQAWIDARVAAYPALKALLHVHLSGPPSPWSWQHNDAALIQRKAVTVIFEYMFTVELLTAGIGMPINQGLGYRLRARLGRHG